MRPVWFLDVDGVLSPVDVDYDELGWDGGFLLEPVPGGRVGDHNCPFRRSVVDRIAELHGGGIVEVRWLTSWTPTMVRDWEKVGLVFEHQAPDPFSVPDKTPAWFKARVVLQFLKANPGRPVVWTDDQIIRRGRLRDLPDHVLTIKPRPSVGLTGADLDRIEEWCRNGT